MNFLCHLCIAPIPCNMYDTAQGSSGVTAWRRGKDVLAISTRREITRVPNGPSPLEADDGQIRCYSRRVIVNRGDANVFRHPLYRAAFQPSLGFPPSPTCEPGAPVSGDLRRAILPYGAQNSAGSEYITPSTSMSRTMIHSLIRTFRLPPSAPRSVTAARSASRSAPDAPLAPPRPAGTRHQYRTGSPGGPR